jgi:hypothetical protein
LSCWGFSCRGSVVGNNGLTYSMSISTIGSNIVVNACVKDYSGYWHCNSDVYGCGRYRSNYYCQGTAIAWYDVPDPYSSFGGTVGVTVYMPFSITLTTSY